MFTLYSYTFVHTVPPCRSAFIRTENSLLLMKSVQVWWPWISSDEFEGPTCIRNISAQEVVVVHHVNAVNTWGALAFMLERSLRVSNCLLRTYVMLLTWRVLHLSHSLFYFAFLLFPLCPPPSTALFDVMARKTWRTDCVLGLVAIDFNSKLWRWWQKWTNSYSSIIDLWDTSWLSSGVRAVYPLHKLLYNPHPRLFAWMRSAFVFVWGVCNIITSMHSLYAAPLLGISTGLYYMKKSKSSEVFIRQQFFLNAISSSRIM